MHQCIGFRGLDPGTVGPSLSLHASRQLSGEVLRYLKRVIVTPAVYRPFAPLYRGFRYRHWAGFSRCTHPFGLAPTYVFVKQSESPSHCDLPLREVGTPSTEGTGPICRIPSGRLVPHALGFSPRGPVSVLGTVVGLTPAGFSRAPGISQTLTLEGPSRIHPLLRITRLRGLRRLDTAATVLGLARSVTRWAEHPRGRNINRLPFRYAPLRAHLRTA